MFEINVMCPKCKTMRHHTFGEGDLVHLGDTIKDSKKSYATSHRYECHSCNNVSEIVEIVDNGKFVNILIDPTNEQKESIRYGVLPRLYSYGTISNYYVRKNLLLGEDSEVIPSQMATDSDLGIGNCLLLFDQIWEITSKYKVAFASEERDISYAEIFEIVLDEKTKRLLVLRDGYMPTLEYDNWKHINEKIVGKNSLIMCPR